MGVREGFWVSFRFYSHRAIQGMGLAEKYIATRMLGMVDSWGRLSTTAEAMEEFADAIGATDDDVASVLSVLTTGARSLLLSYNDGRTAVFGRWDGQQTKEFLRKRGWPQHDEPPLAVWRAGHCSRVFRQNQTGKITESHPGWYPGAGKGRQGQTRADKGRQGQTGNAVGAPGPTVCADEPVQPAVITEGPTGADKGRQGQTRAPVSVQSPSIERELELELEQGSKDPSLPDSRADARGGAFAWKAEAGDLFGSIAEMVVDIIERVADARGYGTDPEIVWQSAKPALKSAAGMHHFKFALESFQTRMTEDHGRSMYLGNGPWNWIRTLAGNGPRTNNQQQRKAPVGTMHETNRRQAAGEYGPPVDLPPGEGSDVGVSTW